MAAAKNLLSEKSQKALAKFEEGQSYHDQLIEKYDARLKAYDAILEMRDNAADWQHRVHAPYVQHIVETTLAGQVDERFHFSVKPIPKFYSPEEASLVRQGAKAHEILHRAQLKADRFNSILRPFALQNAIYGITVAKTFWKQQRAMKKRLDVEIDETGAPRLVEREYPANVYDGPSTEVVNVRDFFWHEAATRLDRSPWVAHRIFLTYEELKIAERLGTYKNVDALKGKTGAPDVAGSDYEGRDRTKGMIEVLEIWWRDVDGIWVTTIGARSVELREPRPNPFWHGEYPFTVAAAQPGLFKMTGLSQVEKIAHIQSALWDLENQTLDNVSLLNNVITLIRSDTDDPDAFKFEPGARWLVEDPNQVSAFNPNQGIATLTMPHLSRLESMMQNLAGGHPFTTTSEGTVNANTATEASLITNLATRSIMAQKAQLNLAYEDVGCQRTYLNQQFIRTPQIVEVVGLDDEQEWATIGPLVLQGEYTFDTTAMTESMFRQERRSEAQGMLQMALSAIPVVVGLSQQGAATMLNLDAFIENYLEAFDIVDKERFFSRAAPAQAPTGPGQPDQQDPNAPPGPGGVTAPQSIDPATSPSNQSSMSPEVFMQRLQAAAGGVANGADLSGS